MTFLFENRQKVPFMRKRASLYTESAAGLILKYSEVTFPPLLSNKFQYSVSNKFLILAGTILGYFVIVA